MEEDRKAGDNARDKCPKIMDKLTAFIKEKEEDIVPYGIGKIKKVMNKQKSKTPVFIRRGYNQHFHRICSSIITSVRPLSVSSNLHILSIQLPIDMFPDFVIVEIHSISTKRAPDDTSPSR